MASTTIQALPYPVIGDVGNAPSWLLQLAQAVEVKLNMIFASTAARDAAIPSPTAGMECFITGTLEKQRRVGTSWVVVGGKQSAFAMAAGTVTMTMTSGTASGTAAVTFPTGRFTATPLITLGLSGAPSDLFTGGLLTSFSTSTTGFTMEILAASAWGATQTVAANWIAAQMTSTTAAG